MSSKFNSFIRKFRKDIHERFHYYVYYRSFRYGDKVFRSMWVDTLDPDLVFYVASHYPLDIRHSAHYGQTYFFLNEDL